jgi:hypothetical protein
MCLLPALDTAPPLNTSVGPYEATPVCKSPRFFQVATNDRCQVGIKRFDPSSAPQCPMINILKGAKELPLASTSYADQAVLAFPAIGTVQDKLKKPEWGPYV